MLRNFKEGKKITSLDEVYLYRGFIWMKKYYDLGWIVSWQVSFLKNQINRGELFIAEQIGGTNSGRSDTI